MRRGRIVSSGDGKISKRTMIKAHRKLALQDLSGRGHDVGLEVNWNKSKEVKDCKYVKIKVGDGPEAVIKQDHLFTLLMAISPPKQTDKMVGTMATYQGVKNYHTVVNIQAKNDIQKGDLFGVPLTVSVNDVTGGIIVKP